jgi:hypothetical protein
MFSHDEVPKSVSNDISLGVSSIQDHQDIPELNLQKKKVFVDKPSLRLTVLKEHQDNFIIDDRECKSMLMEYPADPPTFSN